MARLEFGLSEFLFGSCSALCGIKHGIPGLGPAETYSSKGAEVRLCKTEQCARKKPRPLVPCYPQPRQPRSASSGGVFFVWSPDHPGSRYGHLREDWERRAAIKNTIDK
jgi:hypothetical protein